MFHPARSSSTDYDRVRKFFLKKSSRLTPLTKELNGDTDLDENQFIDSFGVLELVAYLEDEFDIQIPRKEITLERLGTINKIITLIQSKRSSFEK